MFCTATISKFEIGRRLFENFGKFEERSSKFLEIRKFEKFQMNDTNLPILFEYVKQTVQMMSFYKILIGPTIGELESH